MAVGCRPPRVAVPVEIVTSVPVLTVTKPATPLLSRERMDGARIPFVEAEAAATPNILVVVRSSPLPALVIPRRPFTAFTRRTP